MPKRRLAELVTLRGLTVLSIALISMLIWGAAALVSPKSGSAASLPACYSQPATGYDATKVVNCSEYVGVPGVTFTPPNDGHPNENDLCFLSTNNTTYALQGTEERCKQLSGDVAKYNGSLAGLKTNPIVKALGIIVNVLVGGVGVIVIGSIIFAGIQYMTAGDNVQAVQAAKLRIYKSIIALIAFFFTWAFLQYLIPGGVFNV